MKNLILLLTLITLIVTSGCTSLQATGGGVGIAASHQFDMDNAWGNYYKAVEAQQQAVEVVSIELTDDGRVKGFKVFQAPERVAISVPQKSYSPGWQVAEKALGVMTPWVGAWAIADSINRYNSKNYANGNGDISNSYNTRGDTPTDSFNDFSNQGNPINNSQQPVMTDNSNQGNPINNSNQGNPIDTDNRSNYSNSPAMGVDSL